MVLQLFTLKKIYALPRSLNSAKKLGGLGHVVYSKMAIWPSVDMWFMRVIKGFEWRRWSKCRSLGDWGKSFVRGAVLIFLSFFSLFFFSACKTLKVSRRAEAPSTIIAGDKLHWHKPRQQTGQWLMITKEYFISSGYVLILVEGPAPALINLHIHAIFDFFFHILSSYKKVKRSSSFLSFSRFLIVFVIEPDESQFNWLFIPKKVGEKWKNSSVSKVSYRGVG